MSHSAARVWTINGDFLALPPNGVVRYAREVTIALDRLVAEAHPLARHLELEIIAPRPAAESLPLTAIPLRVVTEFNRPRIPQFWVQMQLPWHVRGGLLSFCNLGPVAIRRQIVCIHDLQTRFAPESYARGFRLAHRVLLPILGRASAGVTTVSEFSRRHLVDFGIAPEPKLVVTHNGHEHATRWEAARATVELPRNRPFALSLGRKQKHKNHELLRRISAPLGELGVDMCIAGDVDPSDLFGGRFAAPTNIKVLGRISDDDLAKALDQALCFLLPSRTEGFGLPALEAMARGCPTIVSRVASLPEVCGDAALYAAPDNDTEWVAAVRQLVNDPLLRNGLRARGLERARSYSWRKIGESYLAMMAQIDARLPITGEKALSAIGHAERSADLRVTQ
jgi:glycosyltransferase involved in cell wall biosynthesis